MLRSPVISRARLFSAGVLAALLLNGCSSLQSTGDPALVYKEEKPIKAGSPYYLPKGEILIAGAPDAQGRFVVTVAPTVQPETERKPFYVRYRPGIFVNDYVRVQANPSGLLESVTFMDNNPNWNVVAQGALPAVTLTFSGKGNPASFSRRIDPLDPHSVDAFRAVVGNACRLRFRVPDPLQVSSRPCKESTYDGIVFHPAIPVVLDVTCGDDTQQAVVPIPDRRVTLAYTFDRGLVDERGTELEFMDGMLTTVHIANQSLVTVILGVPKTILESVLPLPPGW